MWSRLTRITEPSDPAVSLSDAKAHLRVDHDAEDALIEALVKSATAMIDGPDGIGFALQEQAWRVTLDGFHMFDWMVRPIASRERWDGRADERIRIALRPVVSVDAVTYVDTAGDEQTLPDTDYRVSIAGGVATITPVNSWPTVKDEPGAVRIDFTAGEGTPDALRAAILLMVGHLYENRQGVVTGTIATELPLAWDAIVSRYRSGMISA